MLHIHVPGRHIRPGRKSKTFHVAFLLSDCQTSYGRRLIVPDEDQLLSVIRKLGGDAGELRHKLETWGQGSVHPSEAQVGGFRAPGNTREV